MKASEISAPSSAASAVRRAPASSAASNVTKKGLGTVSGRANPGVSQATANRMHDRPSDFHINDRHDVMRIPPRERDFLEYGRLAKFYDRDPHYFGYRIKALPPKCRKVRHFGFDYYVYNDIYYRPFGNSFVVCRPPAGISIGFNVGPVRFNLVNFSFFNNRYMTYRGFDSYSRYIDEQNRTIAQNNAIIASQNRDIAMNLSLAQDSYSLANKLGLVQSYAYADQPYYYEDGVFYIQKGNDYKVIVPPAGALVEELPDDYDTITLSGNQYYRVDDTVYRTTLVSGRPYLEVLGQMYGNMAKRYAIY